MKENGEMGNRAYRADSIRDGLTDVGFERVVTPRLLRWIYLGAMAWISAATIVGVLMVWSFAAWLGWGWWILAPVVMAGGLVTLLAVRVVLESVLMWFTGGRGIPPRTAAPGREGSGGDHERTRAVDG